MDIPGVPLRGDDIVFGPGPAVSNQATLLKQLHHAGRCANGSRVANVPCRSTHVE